MKKSIVVVGEQMLMSHVIWNPLCEILISRKWGMVVMYGVNRIIVNAYLMTTLRNAFISVGRIYM